MLRAAAVAEKLGIPTASIISSPFLKQAEVVKKGLAVPLAIGVYPGVPLLDSDEELARKVNEVLAPGLLAALTAEVPKDAPEEAGSDPAPDSVVFSGTLREVQEHFHRKMWTDGLPVIPATPEAVSGRPGRRSAARSAAEYHSRSC